MEIDQPAGDGSEHISLRQDADYPLTIRNDQARDSGFGHPLGCVENGIAWHRRDDVLAHDVADLQVLATGCGATTGSPVQCALPLRFQFHGQPPQLSRTALSHAQELTFPGIIVVEQIAYIIIGASDEFLYRRSRAASISGHKYVEIRSFCSLF
jgi:hypothetical protein